MVCGVEGVVGRGGVLCVGRWLLGVVVLDESDSGLGRLECLVPRCSDES